MITAKLAKTVMEHEEGLNHLWIRIGPLPSQMPAELLIAPPDGVHLMSNISGIHEHQLGRLIVDNAAGTAVDILVPLYTQESAVCGATHIALTLAYSESDGSSANQTTHVPLLLLPAEDMEDPALDEEVVERLKLLESSGSKASPTNYVDAVSPSRIIPSDLAAISEWEKKYRIEWMQ